MMNGGFIIYDYHNVKQPGVDYGNSYPKVIAINIKNKTIAIHQKGQTGWIGRGTTGYSPSFTSFGTFENIVSSDADGRFVVKGFKNLLETKSTNAKSIESLIETIRKFEDAERSK